MKELKSLKSVALVIVKLYLYVRNSGASIFHLNKKLFITYRVGKIRPYFHIEDVCFIFLHRFKRILLPIEIQDAYLVWATHNLELHIIPN